jgi:hypothetical protein
MHLRDRFGQGTLARVGAEWGNVALARAAGAVSGRCRV